MRAHVPVLWREAIEILNVQPDGYYIDATLGAGGHAEEILRRLDKGKLIGIDRDPAALAFAGERLKQFGEKLITMPGNFAQINDLYAARGFSPADGLLADLGMSTMQLEDASRGFSFSTAGPLDMQMGPNSGPNAADLVNEMSEQELADVIFKLGEERHSRRVARAIVKGRPFRSTTELAQVVTRAIPSRTALRHIHPATRTFQALRMAVNRELECLESLLAQALEVLKPGGRVVILSFHSLEDRLVKWAFKAWQREGRARILTRRVVRPSEEEIAANPRSRSAKLRAAERCAG
ncbi:MAG: 16S rRNA (cytosine(1402)-N(4))-methyltransferase RsmH [Terriglobia bacterium]|jgi:16S rRNA (cytosine1402-N4)-methyltransferase